MSKYLHEDEFWFSESTWFVSERSSTSLSSFKSSFGILVGVSKEISEMYIAPYQKSMTGLFAKSC